MESLNFQKVHVKKCSAKPQKHRHLRKIAKLLHYVEVCVVLVLISRFSTQLPVAIKNSCEYFRNFMGSPRFVFLLGNVIIMTLFAQSGHFSTHASAKPASEPDLYLEFLQNSTINHKVEAEDNRRKEKASARACQSNRGDESLIEEKHSTKTEGKGYRRCESEIVARVQSEKPRRMLQRCETERMERERERERRCYPEDGMSNDEFRRKVEAFIARQQRLRTQEHSETAVDILRAANY
ncbi:uncharacterized protein LOC113865421 [Abrus precatorius]|uniref:Uncharacterized protein LOC113865421 n=1 Tax=Abrus precatorius TaxID=3816 RepID=A0A8B8LK55_ABRPR|nr:uncharacterized protein LOC113865421 [Abrus precatorius]